MMTEKKNKEETTRPVEMQLTPMIDVTFLILIFFMCSINFKLLDGKLSAYLPNDKGVNAPELTVNLERIKIGLKKSDSAISGYSILLNDTKVLNLSKLHSDLKWFYDQNPKLEIVIAPGKGIEYGHVVDILNESLRAGFSDIHFCGIRMDI